MKLRLGTVNEEEEKLFKITKIKLNFALSEGEFQELFHPTTYKK